MSEKPSWDHPVHETNVPAANPTAVRTDFRSPEHYLVRDHDDEYETACGRQLGSSGVIKSAWKHTHYRAACRTCAAATGLLDLDTGDVLEFARDELGRNCLVEPREVDGPDIEERPLIDIAPRADPPGMFFGPQRLDSAVDRTMRHLDYSLVRVEIDHRNAPLAVFSPVVRAEVTVVEGPGRRQ